MLCLQYLSWRSALQGSGQSSSMKSSFLLTALPLTHRVLVHTNSFKKKKNKNLQAVTVDAPGLPLRGGSAPLTECHRVPALLQEARRSVKLCKPEE